MIRALLNTTATIKRANPSVVSSRLTPASWTTVASGVPARFVQEGTTPETTVLGLAGRQAYRAFLAYSDSWVLQPEDQVEDAGGVKYRVVDPILREGFLPSGESWNYWEAVVERRDA